jgi:acetyl-CoA carboxylase biotin carboxyl carrier protein
MNLDDIREILDLVREHDLAELEIERDGLKVRVRKAGHAAPVNASVVPMVAAVASTPPAPVVAAPVAAPAAPAETSDLGVDLAVIKSPIVGTFYRAPEPGARPFVEVGDSVKKGQVLCIIEAMKLMNEIESECDGELTAIYVENGKPVQFGDRLFAIRVAGADKS